MEKTECSTQFVHHQLKEVDVTLLCPYAEFLPAVLIRDFFSVFTYFSRISNIHSAIRDTICFLPSMTVYFCKYLTRHETCSLTFRFQVPLCMLLFYLTIVMIFSISRYNWHLREKLFVTSNHAYFQSSHSAVSSLYSLLPRTVS